MNNDVIIKIKDKLEKADAILIGAGAGLSTSAGYTYTGERFNKYFSDFKHKYNFTDMYSGGFYPFKSLEQYWAYWSRYIYINRYMDSQKDTYTKLLSLVHDKNYFVLTTNVDHCFQRAGFNKERLFYTQGDYGLLQCSTPCCNKTYDNYEVIKKMVDTQKDMEIDSLLVPYCPNCGKPLVPNLRADDTFVQDEGWDKAFNNYYNFIEKYKNSNIVFVELGVGFNTPVIIKYPFWQMCNQNPNSTYICINKGEQYCPVDIKNRSICINDDIDLVLNELVNNN